MKDDNYFVESLLEKIYKALNHIRWILLSFWCLAVLYFVIPQNCTSKLTLPILGCCGGKGHEVKEEVPIIKGKPELGTQTKSVWKPCCDH